MRLDEHYYGSSNKAAIVRSVDEAEMTQEEYLADNEAMQANTADSRQRLLRICEKKGYKHGGYATAEEYAQEEHGRGRQWLILELKAARIEQNVQQVVHFRVPTKAINLGCFPDQIMDSPEMIQAIVSRAVELAAGKKPAVAHYQQASQELLGDNEPDWEDGGDESDEEDGTRSPASRERGRHLPRTVRLDPPEDPDDDSIDDEDDVEDWSETDEEDEQDRAEAEARQLEKSGISVEAPDPDEELAGTPSTEEEFLLSLPLRNKLSLPCRKKFDSDAIKYLRHRDNPATEQYKRLIDRLLKDRDIQIRGPFHNKLASHISGYHPRDWKLCITCQGSGISQGAKCTVCKGDGYVIN